MDNLLPTIMMFMFDYQLVQNIEKKSTHDFKLFRKYYLSSKSQHQDITNEDKIEFGQSLMRCEEYYETTEKYKQKNIIQL